jgi:phosphate/sulfate permease
VGAVIGSGLADKALSLPGTIDWQMLGKIGISWLLTIPLAMAISCAIFAAGRGAFDG